MEGWPSRVEIFPRLDRVIRLGKHVVRFLTPGVRLFSPVSDHEFNHGAAATLDHELYDGIEVTPLMKDWGMDRYITEGEDFTIPPADAA